MTKKPEEGEIPDWQLERYALSELPAEEMRQLAQALERDPAARERLAALEADSAALLSAHPPHAAVATIRARLAGEMRRRSTAWRPVLALAAPMLVAAVAVGIWLREPPPPDESSSAQSDTTRTKGAATRLLLFRQAKDGVETLSSGARAKAGDLVQLAYQAGGGRYGVIVSVDGRGVVTPHLPASGTSAAALRAEGPVTLEAAYRLDDAPRFEAFYFVTSSRVFDLAAIRSAAAAAAARGEVPPDPLSLPASFDQTVFLLRKDTAR
jgi:anti-sigma factor RsiW